MKNLRKALAAVLAMSVISVSGSALAATGCTLTGDGATFDATYDAEANSLTAEVLTGATIGEQMTFVILDQGADSKAEIEASDILYIDQKELTAYGDSFTGVINLARVSGAVDSMPEGSYPVRLGYNTASGFKMATGNLVIESAGDEETTISIIWGDVDCDGIIAGSDVTTVLMASVSVNSDVAVTDGVNSATIATGDEVEFIVDEQRETLPWGDIDCDGIIAGSDVTTVLMASVSVNSDIAFGTTTVTTGDDCAVVAPVAEEE